MIIFSFFSFAIFFNSLVDTILLEKIKKQKKLKKIKKMKKLIKWNLHQLLILIFFKN